MFLLHRLLGPCRYCNYQEQEGKGKVTPREVEERGKDVVVEARYNPKIILHLGPYE